MEKYLKTSFSVFAFYLEKYAYEQLKSLHIFLGILVDWYNIAQESMRPR